MNCETYKKHFKQPVKHGIKQDKIKKCQNRHFSLKFVFKTNSIFGNIVLNITPSIHIKLLIVISSSTCMPRATNHIAQKPILIFVDWSRLDYLDFQSFDKATDSYNLVLSVFPPSDCWQLTFKLEVISDLLTFLHLLQLCPWWVWLSVDSVLTSRLLHNFSLYRGSANYLVTSHWISFHFLFLRPILQMVDGSQTGKQFWDML